MRVWFVLTLALFLGRCADQLKPYLASFVGAQPTADDVGTAAAASHAHPKSLRLASWNLEWLDSPGRGTKARQRGDYARLAYYAARLNADVIAVQEVASELALALVFPPDRYAYHLAKQGGSQRSGFVYKRSLTVQSYPDLSALGEHDLRAGADLGVRLGPHELRLLSIHLKAFCVTGPLTGKDADCRKLAAQLPALEGWVDARARESLPFAVVGDFNRALGDADELLRELDDGDPSGLRLARATPTRRARCTEGRHEAVDHVLLGGPARAWLRPEGFAELTYLPGDAEQAQLSDHCPLSIELLLR